MLVALRGISGLSFLLLHYEFMKYGSAADGSRPKKCNRSVSVGEMAIVKLCAPGGASVGAPPRLGASAEAHFALYDFDWLEQ